MGREEYEEKKRQDIASFVQGGVVDWERWEILGGSDGSYNQTLHEGLISHLVEIGILSLDPEGNHRVYGGRFNLNPNESGMIETYFTSRDQARSYANTLFSGAHYSVRIEKLSDIETIQQEN